MGHLFLFVLFKIPLDNRNNIKLEEGEILNDLSCGVKVYFLANPWKRTQNERITCIASPNTGPDAVDVDFVGIKKKNRFDTGFFPERMFPKTTFVRPKLFCDIYRYLTLRSPNDVTILYIDIQVWDKLLLKCQALQCQNSDSTKKKKKTFWDNTIMMRVTENLLDRKILNYTGYPLTNE